MNDILAAEIMKWCFNVACLFFVIWALTGCAPNDYQKMADVLYEAKSGFTYVDQGLDFPPLSVDCANNKGNCNDFAVCVKQLMDESEFQGTKLEVCTRNGIPHMVVSYQDVILDNWNDRPISRNSAGYDCDK